jgi:hypothetical protein
MDLKDLLYCPLDIENPPVDFLDHLNNINLDKLVTDEYRSCYHVPIMFDFKPGKFTYTPFAFPYKSLREWCEDVLFPITGKSRIMIITTPPGVQNPPHIDCSKEKFLNTLQHKFRYVLQGNIDDLYFMTNNEDVQCPSGPDKPFIMSGSWPHWMTNTTNEIKFTLALGAPWDGSEDDDQYVNLMQKSFTKYNDYYLGKGNKVLPDDYESLFEENYTHRKKAEEFSSFLVDK